MKNIGNRTETLHWSENVLDVKAVIERDEQPVADQSKNVRVIASRPSDYDYISIVPAEELVIAFAAFVPKPGIYCISFSIASSPTTMEELNIDVSSSGSEESVEDVVWSSQTMVVVQ